MIIEYGMRNFFSFREGASISFEIPDKGDEQVIARTACIKGANGSGKTHVLRTPSIISSICAMSFHYGDEDLIPIESFYRSEDPTELYIVFTFKNIEYRYEIELTEKKISRETLYRKRGKRKVKILERTNNKITHSTSEFESLNIIKLKNTASIISTAHQYDNTSLEDIYIFFKNIISNVGYSGRNEDFIPSIEKISAQLKKSPVVFKFVKDFIMSCDIGISDIKIFSSTGKDGKEEYYPMFIHKTSNGRNNFVSRYTESSGTLALFRQLSYYIMALNAGTPVLMDEFDINLHSDILPKIINMFENDESNPNNAQLIFTTHNDLIMDQQGRYKTFLVNKENNESYIYRLDEIPGDILRNDRPISPVYRQGKIGGVPRI